MKNLTDHSIPAPSIPVAAPDGLIKLSDLNQDVITQFPVWEGARPGDAYQLALNGINIGEKIDFPNPVPEGILTARIPLSVLQTDGTHRISYRITSFPGGFVIDSPTTTIRIDRTAPGAALLAPLILPQINFGEMLSGHVPGYAGMAIGDHIQTLCNGIEGPVCTIVSEHMKVQPVRIDFERQWLEGLDSRTLTFSYRITDRAGNRSLLACPVTLTLCDDPPEKAFI